MGMGAVCHTLNPRLMASQLAAMLVQSEARVLIASADLAPLVQQMLAQAPLVAHVLVIDGVAANFQPPQRECSIAAPKPAVAAARNDAAWGGFDEPPPRDRERGASGKQGFRRRARRGSSRTNRKKQI